MRVLLDADLLDGSCLTVTGRTVAENLASVAAPDRSPAVRCIAIADGMPSAHVQTS